MRKFILLIIITGIGYIPFQPHTEPVSVETEQPAVVTVAKVETPPEPAPEAEAAPKSEAELRKELIAANPKGCTSGQLIIWPDGECKDQEIKASSSSTPVNVSAAEQQAIEYYRSVGFTDVAIAQLLGTIKAESGFKTYNPGDGGKANGLFQWHPDRRYDMPSDYAGQLAFSVKEMQRDGGGVRANIYNLLQTSNDKYAIRSAIKDWIRWGHLGNRWIYADQYQAMLS